MFNKFRNKLSRDPYDAETFTIRGDMWRRKSDYDRAIVDFNEAIRLDPNLTKQEVECWFSAVEITWQPLIQRWRVNSGSA